MKCYCIQSRVFLEFVHETGLRPQCHPTARLYTDTS